MKKIYLLDIALCMTTNAFCAEPKAVLNYMIKELKIENDTEYKKAKEMDDIIFTEANYENSKELFTALLKSTDLNLKKLFLLREVHQKLKWEKELSDYLKKDKHKQASQKKIKALETKCVEVLTQKQMLLKARSLIGIWKKSSRFFFLKTDFESLGI